MAEDPSESTRDESESAERLEELWDGADSDPDLEDDLGYEAISLDVLVTSNTDKKVMVLPRAQEWIKEDAYIIADFDLACDPVENA